MRPSPVVKGFVVPGMPHPLLVPERSPAWGSLRRSFEVVREEIEKTEADLLLLYSTQWISIIGHQVQADPAPEWVLVDPEWHEYGSMPYRFRIDADYAAAYEKAARARGLSARTVAYRGFPIDTGTVVALKLLNPQNRLPACVVSCNMYADRAETLVLGKAAADALRARGKKAIALAVTLLSARLFTREIDPKEDRISSLKDDEWNRKLLELLGEGRLEDVSQLAREFSVEANGDQKLKAIWWLAAAMGEHNDYEGKVFDYQPVWGAGAALVGLTPVAQAAARLEFDEEDVETFAGDRGVLSGGRAAPVAPNAASEHAPQHDAVFAKGAPAPVGAYPHARRVGDLLYLSGIGPRLPGSDEVPGGPVRDKAGNRLPYDAGAQTRQCVENVKRVLAEAGSSLEKVRDVTVFLIDMDRDFAAFNAVWTETLGRFGPTRTTVAVSALPTPIAVEMKVIAEMADRP